MAELKPCPFCGKDATCRVVTCGTYNDSFNVLIGCEPCHVTMRMGFTYETDKQADVCIDMLKQIWNRRAET